MTPGAYKDPLAAGLTELGESKLAKQTLAGDLKIAVARSIVGSVVRRADLAELYISALKEARVYADGMRSVCDYYIRGLQSGQLVPVVTASADVVYTDGRTTATPGPEKEWAPGELFLKS